MTKIPIPFDISPKQMHVQDFGGSTVEPDYIERQKQDYFDKWEMTSREFISVKRLG